MSCSVGANSVRPLTAKVITVSDRSFRGEREDLSGPAVKNLLERAGYAVGAVEVLPDEQPRIESALIHAADEEKLALIVTTGGTGFAPRDVTPEYYLPFAVDALIKDGKATAKVLTTDSRWYGVTYREDKPTICAAVATMTENGDYPADL